MSRSGRRSPEHVLTREVRKLEKEVELFLQPVVLRKASGGELAAEERKHREALREAARKLSTEIVTQLNDGEAKAALREQTRGVISALGADTAAKRWLRTRRIAREAAAANSKRGRAARRARLNANQEPRARKSIRTVSGGLPGSGKRS